MLSAHVPWCTCGGQRTTYGKCFSSSTLLVSTDGNQGSAHSVPGDWKGLFPTLAGGSSTSTCPLANSLAGPCCRQSFSDIDPNYLGYGGGTGGTYGKVQAISGVCQRSRKPWHLLCHGERKLEMVETHAWCSSRR